MTEEQILIISFTYPEGKMFAIFSIQVFAGPGKQCKIDVFQETKKEFTITEIKKKTCCKNHYYLQYSLNKN